MRRAADRPGSRVAAPPARPPGGFPQNATRRRTLTERSRPDQASRNDFTSCRPSPLTVRRDPCLQLRASSAERFRDFSSWRRLGSGTSDVFQVRPVRSLFQARLAEYTWGGTRFGPWFYPVGPEQAALPHTPSAEHRPFQPPSASRSRSPRRARPGRGFTKQFTNRGGHEAAGTVTRPGFTPS